MAGPIRINLPHGRMQNTKPKPAKSKLTVFRQICQRIPGYFTTEIAHELGLEEESRTFSPWSHTCSMMYAQVAHSQSLTDLCDSLDVEASALKTIRGATPPSHNGLSHANRNRNADFAETLYWRTEAHLKTSHPKFGVEHGKKNFAYRFKSRVHLVDATTIQLVANCMGWAKHRRRKAGIKCHCRLDLQSYLPSFVLIDTAAEHENTRAREVCLGLKAGEIAVLDKGFIDFGHFHDLHLRGVFWVTRAKDSMAYLVVRTLNEPAANIVRDVIIRFQYHNAKQAYPAELRLVEARVEVDGKPAVMTFITNNLHWQPQSVADLYRCRWQIELFFKSLKQNLQVADFLGYNANAVRWQIWTALLVHLIMRFLAWQSRWTSSFGRVFTLLRATAWRRLDLESLLKLYGTAGANKRIRTRPEQAFLPGIC
jgi:hypothetical protein